jgi:hypothetical protein
MTTHQAAHVAVLEAIRNAYAAMVCPTAFDKVRALDAAIELMKQAGEPVAKLTTYEDTRAITARIHDVAHSLSPGTYDLYAAPTEASR